MQLFEKNGNVQSFHKISQKIAQKIVSAMIVNAYYTYYLLRNTPFQNAYEDSIFKIAEKGYIPSLLCTFEKQCR